MSPYRTPPPREEKPPSFKDRWRRRIRRLKRVAAVVLFEYRDTCAECGNLRHRIRLELVSGRTGPRRVVCNDARFGNCAEIHARRVWY